MSVTTLHAQVQNLFERVNGTIYHFYDPATSHMDIGTRGTNVLYVSGGFLTGAFLKPGNIKYNEYIVTSIRLNK